MWFKVDDKFPRHRKTRHAGRILGGKFALARIIATWLEAGCFCSEFLTDGLITDAELVDLQVDSEPKEVGAALVEASLWRRVDGGYQFHEWDQYQPSAAGVREKRARDRRRKAQGHGDSSDQPSEERSEAVDGIVVESTAIPFGLLAESTAIPSGIRAESEALACARSRPDPSDRSKAEDPRALRARRPARMRMARIGEVRPHLQTAVHCLFETGGRFIHADGQPNVDVMLVDLHETARLLNALCQDDELRSVILGVAGERNKRDEVDLLHRSFRTRKDRKVERQVRRALGPVYDYTWRDDCRAVHGNTCGSPRAHDLQLAMDAARRDREAVS